MLSIESGTDAASGLAIAILDDAKILIPLNQASKDYSLHSGKVPLTFYAQLRPVNSDVQSGKVNASATFVLLYDYFVEQIGALDFRRFIAAGGG